MTISTNDAREEYTATSGQTVFNYTFKIYASSDLNVYQTAAGADFDDTADIITAYTVTGVGNSSGGTITLTTGATAGDRITIVSNIPSSRTTDYQVSGDFTANTVNEDIDRTVSLQKQAEAIAKRALLFPESQQGTTALTLPTPSANSFMRWKSDLSGLENQTIGNSGLTLGNAYANYAAVRAIDSSTLNDGDYLWVEGQETPLQVKTGTVSDNSGTLIVFTDDSNRYAERVFSGDVVAEWFDDGTRTDLQYVQAAVDSLPSRGGSVLLSENLYAWSSPGLIINSVGCVHLKGVGGLGNNSNARTRINFTGAGICITFGNTGFSVQNGSTMSDIYIEGDNTANQIGIKVYRTYAMYFERVKVNEMIGAGSIGWDFDGTGDTTIINTLMHCGIRKVTRGINCVRATSVVVIGGYYNAVGGSYGAYVITEDTFQALGANFDGWTVAAIAAVDVDPYRGLRVTGCRFESNAIAVQLGAATRGASIVGNFMGLGGTGYGVEIANGALDVICSGNVPNDIGTGALVRDLSVSATRNHDSFSYTQSQFAFRTDARQIVLETLNTAVTGTGSVTNNGGGVVTLDTGATAGSTALIRTHDFMGFSDEKAGSVIDFSKRVTFTFRIIRASAGAVNGLIRVSLGKSTSDGVGALANKGIGVQFNRWQPDGFCHNGSALTTTSIFGSNIATESHTFTIMSDGAGNIEYWLDGTMTATSTGGPTGDSVSGDSVIQIEVDNTSDAVSHSLIMSDIRIHVEQY